MYQSKDHTNQKHIVTKSNNIDITDQKSLLEITRKLSRLVSQGDNLFLYGELGVGKTTFVRNFINQLQYLNNYSHLLFDPSYQYCICIYH